MCHVSLPEDKSYQPDMICMIFFFVLESTSGSVHPVMVSWQSNVNLAHLPGMSCCYLGSMDYTLGIQVCPKKGINPTILLWGWDWDHQTLGKGMDA